MGEYTLKNADAIVAIGQVVTEVKIMNDGALEITSVGRVYVKDEEALALLRSLSNEELVQFFQMTANQYTDDFNQQVHGNANYI